MADGHQDSSQPSKSPEQPAPALRGSTLVVTNLTKLAGVAVFLNETLIRGETRVQVIATCVLFVMGAQAFETMTIRIIDHIFQR